MGSQTKNRAVTAFFLILCLIIPFGLIYYLSTDAYLERSLHWQGNMGAMQQAQNMRKKDQVILLRDERQEIGRNALVYKGIKRKTIYLDYYLLDLDSQQPYAKEISKKEAKKGFSLGDEKYEMLSVSDNVLVLKATGLEERAVTTQ